MSLSVIILTKNEEKNIKRAIESVKSIASEVLVIDSGSTDNTTTIASSLGAKVIFNKWVSYPSQVQFGIDKASQKYVLVIDADEELSKELQESIKSFIEKDLDIGILIRRTFYMGKFLRHIWSKEKRIRIFKKGVCKYEGELHERVICKNLKKTILKGYLNHYSFESLKDQFEKTLFYSQKNAEIYYQKGKKFSIFNLIFNPIFMFIKMYFLKLGFLEGTRGIIIAFSGAFYVFMKYAFLYELWSQNTKNK